MRGSGVYHRRDLTLSTRQGVRVLDGVAWKNPTGGLAFRVFLAAGTDPTRFDFKDRGQGTQISKVYSINSGLMVVGLSQSEGIALTTTEGVIGIPHSAPETELFTDMNVLVAERNGETMDVIGAWMAYHVARFDVQGVLLIDRGSPNDIRTVEGELEEISQEVGLTTCVHVAASGPLGGDTPDAHHPFHAPDAPGKDRMGDIPSNPHRSPLVELTLFEWARWRFLGRARAVASLDVSDLLQAGENPFETVHDSSAGVIQLLGQRIYPWRVREKEEVSFGDHICRQFDNPRANRRWCIAPSRLSPECVWRYVRIVGAEPQAHETKGFWRAMGIRHPDASAAEIVPKTSLIEDGTLIEMSQEVFGHKPVRAPESKVRNAPKAAADAGRTCIVTCMKNEGPFILEWIAYHRAIGVDDFLIYTNDCSDGTDELLDLLQTRGIAQRRDNGFKNSALKPQHWALAAAENEAIVQKSGWAISMDVDEFINIHVGAGKLADLYKAVGDANMISLTWRLFGNGDVHEYTDKFLIDQFERCAPELCRKPHQAWGFKTLFRNIGIYKKMGVHRPKGLKPDLWSQIKWVNGSGKPMPRKLLRNGWRSTTDSYGYNLATMNHYAVRSAESFLVKRDRGRVNHVDRDQGLSYWFRMNNNWEEDRSIQTKRGLLEAEFNRLLEDPEIRAAHGFSVAAHRAKIDELRATQTYSNFYAELTGARMERLARMHNHFGANVFLAGPESVPDAVVEQEDVADDFFFTVAKTETNH